MDTGVATQARYDMMNSYHMAHVPAALPDIMDTSLSGGLPGVYGPEVGTFEHLNNCFGLVKGLGIRETVPLKSTIIPDRGLGGRFAILLVESTPGDSFNLYFNKMHVPLSEGNEVGTKTNGLRFLHFIVPKHEATLCSTREVPVYIERCDYTGNVVGRALVSNFTYTHLPNRWSVGSSILEHQPRQHSEYLHRDVPELTLDATDSFTSLAAAEADVKPTLQELAMCNQGLDSGSMAARRRSLPILPDFDRPDGAYLSSIAEAQEMNRHFSLPGPSIPAAICNNRARLHMPQCLDEPCRGWTDLEWQCKRRLIRFYRYQDGNIIHTAFETVAQEAADNSRAVVSCIFWEEKNECFVTSVDTIFLLESLVNIRFNVEEKNRIRRNLEGFKPLTVTKGHPESGEFFKLIMGFPNPKPRNIEKDIKVFPWRILGHALRKIINKYSAACPDMI